MRVAAFSFCFLATGCYASHERAGDAGSYERCEERAVEFTYSGSDDCEVLGEFRGGDDMVCVPIPGERLTGRAGLMRVLNPTRRPFWVRVDAIAADECPLDTCYEVFPVPVGDCSCDPSGRSSLVGPAPFHVNEVALRWDEGGGPQLTFAMSNPAVTYRVTACPATHPTRD